MKARERERECESEREREREYNMPACFSVGGEHLSVEAEGATAVFARPVPSLRQYLYFCTSFFASICHFVLASASVFALFVQVSGPASLACRSFRREVRGERDPYIRQMRQYLYCCTKKCVSMCTLY